MWVKKSVIRYRLVFRGPVWPLRPGVDDLEPCDGFVRLFGVVGGGYLDQVFGSVGGEEAPKGKIEYK